jgi:plasmid stability protein
VKTAQFDQEVGMADLLIRNIEPQLKRDIQKRARKNRHSLSEEAKLLLRTALLEPHENRKMGTALRELLPEEYRSDDYVFEIRGETSKPPDFE